MTARLAEHPTRAMYDAAFEAERGNRYAVVDAFEEAQGFAVPRGRLERAARVLACPVKLHPPNWQHGRVIYAASRAYLAQRDDPGSVCFVDIGTAKGFSALCLRWAIDDDAAATGAVISTDVIDPLSRVPRNSVADRDGPHTLPELLEAWPESGRITFRCGTGVALLEALARVHVAFVDGKHTAEAVGAEVALLIPRQAPRDLVIFDDVQMPGVRFAVEQAQHWYALEWVTLMPGRAYAIGVRQ